MIQHVPGSISTQDRESGFEEAMAKEFPGIQLVQKLFGMADRAKSMAAAENILTAHPDLGGLFCSTEPSASGARSISSASPVPKANIRTSSRAA